MSEKVEQMTKRNALKDENLRNAYANLKAFLETAETQKNSGPEDWVILLIGQILSFGCKDTTHLMNSKKESISMKEFVSIFLDACELVTKTWRADIENLKP